MKKFIPCRLCVNKHTVPGYISKTLENGYEVVYECDCHKNWREEQDIVYRAIYSNIWCDHVSLNYNPLSDYVGVNSNKEMQLLVKFVNNFQEERIRESSLYLWGPNSTQKTHLVQWMGLTLLRKRYTVFYTSMHQLLKILTEFHERVEKDEMVENLKKIDFLILDESFDKKKVSLFKTGFQIPFLEDFLKERMEANRKATVFVSNVSIFDITKNEFSESIQNLIIRNTQPKGTILSFTDNYHAVNSDFKINTIFEDL